MGRAFVFPGQGSQAVGMGAALAEAFAPARLVFEEVDDALDQRLSRLMFEGPEEQLTLTENAQPALMAVSLAVVRVLQEEAGCQLAEKATFVAGHSLGEYSALAAAGTLELADAARLLKRRGQAMQEAVPVGEGAMAAVLGLDLAAASSSAIQGRQTLHPAAGLGALSLRAHGAGRPGHVRGPGRDNLPAAGHTLGGQRDRRPGNLS